MSLPKFGALVALLFLTAAGAQAASPLVLMTDFGVKDGAVSEVKGVAYGSLLNVSVALNMGDYAHDHAIASGGDWSIRIHR